MRIGYFGGSFDPPHRGHLAVARTAATAIGLDRIFFVPSANQPLKSGGAVASYPDRLAMVSLLCEDCPGEILCIPSELEAPNDDGAPHYTIDTLRGLHLSLGAGDRLFVLAGADAFLDLRRWREPEQLFDLADWVIVSRPGFPLSQLGTLHLNQQQMSRVHLLDTLSDSISATQVRSILAVGGSCEDLLPPQILAYIHEHHLYGT